MNIRRGANSKPLALGRRTPDLIPEFPEVMKTTDHSRSVLKVEQRNQFISLRGC